MWALEDLSAVLGVPHEFLRRKLAFWQQHGVVHEETSGHYSVLEKASGRERPDRGVMLIDSDDEGDSNTTTQSKQREEKLQVITGTCLQFPPTVKKHAHDVND